MAKRKRVSAEETQIKKNFQETNEAARQVISSIRVLQKTLSGQFITPEIDKGLKDSIKIMQQLRNNSTPLKAINYLTDLKNV